MIEAATLIGLPFFFFVNISTTVKVQRVSEVWRARAFCLSSEESEATVRTSGHSTPAVRNGARAEFVQDEEQKRCDALPEVRRTLTPPSEFQHGAEAPCAKRKFLQSVKSVKSVVRKPESPGDAPEE